MGIKDFDDILIKIGGMGPRLWFQFSLLCLVGDVTNPWNAFNLVFTTHSPAFRCQSVQNDGSNGSTAVLDASLNNYEYNSICEYNGSLVSNVSKTILKHGKSTEIPCDDGYVYDQSLLTSTVVTDWDLVCGRSYYIPLIRNVFFAGSVVGLVVMSYVQDRYGRKPALLICVMAIIIGNFGASLSVNIAMFIAFRIIAEFASYSTYNTAYVWTLEMALPSQRTLVSTVFCGMYAVGNSALPLLAYACADWRILCLTTSIAFVPILSYSKLCLESPRWLYTKGRLRESFGVLQDFNRRRFVCRDSDILVKKENISTELEKLLAESLEEDSSANNERINLSAESGEVNVASSENDTQPNALDLFRKRNLRKKACLLYFCLMINNLSYFMAAYSTENVGGNFMINFALQAAIEAPAVFLNLLILNRFGRVLPTFVTMTMSGLSLVLSIAADLANFQMLVVVLTIAGKFFICISFAILFQLCVELFPTEVRATGLATGCLVCAVLNMVIPYIIHLSFYYKLLPQLLIGILTIAGAIVALMLPETKGLQLPETVADAERSSQAGIATAKANMANFKFWKFTDQDLNQATNNKDHLLYPLKETCDEQNDPFQPSVII